MTGHLLSEIRSGESRQVIWTVEQRTLTEGDSPNSRGLSNMARPRVALLVLVCGLASSDPLEDGNAYGSDY